MPANSDTNDRGLWVTSTYCGVIAIYLWLFFSANPHRFASLTLALLPDVVLDAWVGGDWANFAIFGRLAILAMAGMYLLLALVTGWLTVQFIGADRHVSRLEIIVFSLGVGLNQWSLLTLAAGLCRGLQQQWLFLIVALIVAFAAIHQFRKRHRRGTDEKETSAGDLPIDKPSWFGRYGLCLVIPFVVVTMLGATQPPWEFDVREYHSQVPKEWYLDGGASFLSHNVYGNMPLGAEMHSLAVMAFRGEPKAWWSGALVGKAIIGSMALLTALTLLAAGKRFFGRPAGVMAAVIFLSTPWVCHVSQTGLIEVAYGCFFAQAVFAWLIWLKYERDFRNGNRWLWIAGFLAGGAASCKYPAVLFVVVPLTTATLFSPWIRRWINREANQCREPTERTPLRWAMTLQFVLAVAAGCGLWYAKNAAIADNPIYPLVFGGKTRTAEKIEQWNRAHQVPTDQRGRRYSIEQMAQAASQIGWRSELLSPLLVPLSLLAFLKVRRRRMLLSLAVLTIFGLASWWLLTHRIERFVVPLIPIAAMMAGVGASCLDWRPLQVIVRGFVIVGMASSFLLMISPFRDDPSLADDTRYLVALDVLRIDEPDEPGGPSRVNPAHRWLNNNVPSGKSVLLVGDAQPFDLAVPTFYNTCFDDCTFELWMKDRDRHQRRKTFADHNISHVFFHWSDLRRYRQAGNYGYSDYATPELVHNQLVRKQGLLRKVEAEGLEPGFGELFEVVMD